MAVEKKFNDSVLDNIKNTSGMLVGFCLMKDAGVNIDDVCALTWDSIIIYGNTVILKIVREKYTGGTHNYSHPMMPFVSALIVRWHDYYVQVAGKKDMGKMYVIALPTDPFTPIKTSAMTDFIRKELKKWG